MIQNKGHGHKNQHWKSSTSPIRVIYTKLGYLLSWDFVLKQSHLLTLLILSGIY